MMSLGEIMEIGYEIPKIEDDVIFEKLIKEILNANNEIENVNINGRSGQKQDGVDIFYKKHGSWIGVQCKVRSTNKHFSKDELLSEIEKAKSFNPKLSKYYIYTTLSRDAVTQRFVREIDDELCKSEEFSLEMLFWEEIKEILMKKECKNVLFRYYNRFFKDYLTIGQAIGKLVNLDLGFDEKHDTHYELILGTIPENNGNGGNVDYYRGTYFIVNLNCNKMEFFKKAVESGRAECFPSDIASAFDCEIDRYRISKWIESFENFDDFIYEDVRNCFFSIDTEESLEFRKQL